MTIRQALQKAAQEHQAGHADEAAAIYRQVLAAEPRNAEALHRLGMLAHLAGRHEIAADLLWQAISANASEADYHNDLGNTLGALGKADEAAEAFRRAVELKPQYAEAHSNLGIALKMQGRFEEAAAAYRESLRWKPDAPQVHFNLGNLLRTQERHDEAAAAYRRAIELQPGHAQAQHNLGLALAAQGLPDEAEAAYNRALELNPNSAESLLNLGNLISERGHFEEAVEAYRRALRIRPQYAEVFYSLALSLRALGRVEEADAAYASALKFQPNDPDARMKYAGVLLIRGELRAGWPLYEARWAAKSVKFPPWEIRQPLWDGRPLKGERVLIHSEQGFGDAIQFIRYARLVVARGGVPVVTSRRPLVELFRRTRGVAEVIVESDQIPAFDFHLAMLSLPMVFDTTIESIPHDVPYIDVEPARVEAWRQRLGAPGERLRVGLAWAGNPKHQQDMKRSIPLRQLLPLLRVEGVDFFSLQKGRGSEEIAALPADVSLVDLTAELDDFVDTAALMTQLDLVICVDTSVAHLAGAIARPVWTLIAFLPDWRWLLERTDSPWYPTMRLFRQRRYLDWEPTIAEAAEALRNLVAARRTADRGRVDSVPVVATVTRT